MDGVVREDTCEAIGREFDLHCRELCVSHMKNHVTCNLGRMNGSFRINFFLLFLGPDL
jgi:hypothetical protein